jgi:chemotaxis protein methyltransferase WspC
MKTIENLLRERIGLDAASIGSSLIERSVRLRMKSLGLKQTEDYIGRLRASADEWRQLIESVVVSETWFFRDGQAFDALVQIVLGEWLARHPLQMLRILSAPCSTGEEPFSLAMALLDAGILAERFSIEAVDISERALAGARAAVYGRNAFRGKDLAFRDRHFQPTKDGYLLAPRVRACVRFHQLNLLDGPLTGAESSIPGAGEPFHFIFCRNLLIYFDRATQARALGRLRSALATDGVLFVGPAELPLVTVQGFTRLNLNMTFACRRDDGESPAAGAPVHPVSRAGAGAVLPPPVATHKDMLRAELDEPPQPAHVAPVETRDLKHARQLADAGKLAEAQQICEAHARQARPVAEAFYLLGLVADARGEAGALEFYRKAIYLEPDHYESLLQLALLLEKMGDRTGAKSYRRRAERARREPATP